MRLCPFNQSLSHVYKVSVQAHQSQLQYISLIYDNMNINISIIYLIILLITAIQARPAKNGAEAGQEIIKQETENEDIKIEKIGQRNNRSYAFHPYGLDTLGHGNIF